MPPVRSYHNWNKRPSDSQNQVEPYQKYFFICEGANTEVFYFKELVNLRKQLGIHPLIDIRLLEKTDEDESLSNPKRLIIFAEEEKSNPEIEFDPKYDKMVVVFDMDIFRRKPDSFHIDLLSDMYLHFAQDYSMILLFWDCIQIYIDTKRECPLTRTSHYMRKGWNIKWH
ncbi:MAG: RloB family protein [Lachnospiraceae bacterium]|nr:RloB family protein [Lachnospiraceae bacterium]